MYHRGPHAQHPFKARLKKLLREMKRLRREGHGETALSLERASELLGLNEQSAGLEEGFRPMLEKRVECPLRLLAEVAQGDRAVLIGPEALARTTGLEELLNRAPAEFAGRLVVLADPQSAKRLTNPRLRKFTDPDDAMIALAGQAGLEQVTAFGLGAAEPQVLRSASRLGLFIRSLGITNQGFQEFLWLVARALGAPIPQLAPYFNPAGVEEAVREAA